MKNKLLSTILILVMLFTTLVATPEVVFAAPEIMSTPEGDIYASIDVEAHGKNGKGKVLVESVQYNGQGYIDYTGYNTGVFTVDGVKTFFNVDPKSYLDVGDYYYKVSLVDEGAPGVSYDKNTYTIRVYIDYLTNAAGEFIDEAGTVITPNALGEYVDAAGKDLRVKRESIVLQEEEDDGTGNMVPKTEKPEDIKFQNTKEEEVTVTRTITYTKYTPDGEKMFDTVTQQVTLKRTVACDSEGTTMTLDNDGNRVRVGDDYDLLKQDPRRLIVIGENGNPIVYVDDQGRVTADPGSGTLPSSDAKWTPVLADRNGNPIDKNGNPTDSYSEMQHTTVWNIKEDVTNDLGAKTSPTASGWNHSWVDAQSAAQNKKDVPAWYAEGNSDNDYLTYPRKLDLNSPESVREHVVYTEKPTHIEPEYITVTRTIHYREIKRNGDIVYRKVEQKVTLRRDNTVDEDGKLIATGPWQIDSPEASYAAVTSKDKDGWTHRWDEMDGTSREGMRDVLGWNDPANPNRIDLENPHDQVEYVIYTPIGSYTETETKVITRTIYYREYDENGNEVFVPVVQNVTLKKTKTIRHDGKVLDEGKWEIVSDPSEYGYVVSGTKDGWKYDRNVVLGWDDPDNPNRIDLDDPKDQVEYVFYTPIETHEEVEEITITRTITYTEYTSDGKEVSRTVTQTATLKRTKIVDENGNVVSVGGWAIIPEKSDTSAVKTPDHADGADKWAPNTSLVGEWVIDLNNPKNEIVHVIYVPVDQPVPPVEVEEFLTITRTITYTEYTADGKEVSTTVVQTVVLRRIRTEHPDGTVSYSAWEIYEGETDGVKSPAKDGWAANILTVPVWDIDLENPQSEVIHVVYTPVQVIRTGDENRPWIWILLLGGAVVIALIAILLRRRKKDEDEDE